jgi:hypothetical protein
LKTAIVCGSQVIGSEIRCEPLLNRY